MFFFGTKYFTGILYKEVEITGIRGTVLGPVPIQRERERAGFANKNTQLDMMKSYRLQ